MKDDNASLLIDVWEVVKQFVPSKHKSDIAEPLIRVFEDHGSDLEIMYNELEGTDSTLDSAFKILLEEQGLDIDPDDEVEEI